jgi:hypothetical protein
MNDLHTDGAAPAAPTDPAEEGIDEELLALSGPPPSLWYGVVTLAVILLSIIMLVWFFGDLRFLLRGLGEPRELGDAASVDTSTLEHDSYVSIEGIPWFTRTVEFKDGIKWFVQSDNSRKLFPLIGQPEIFVQWAVPDKYKAYRDPAKDPTKPFLPSSFEGRLVRRDRFNRNYDRIWDFVERKLKMEVADDTWLLLADRKPIDSLWVVAVYLVFIGMIAFNGVKLRRFWRAWRA